MTNVPPEIIKGITNKLIDDGKLIEAGWVSLRMSALAADAPKIQVESMREAFFAGAQHLFSSIMFVLDPGGEPTEKDLERFVKIDEELKRFIEDYAKRHIPTQGSS